MPLVVLSSPFNVLARTSAAGIAAITAAALRNAFVLNGDASSRSSQ
jgi:hypothetical protein